MEFRNVNTSNLTFKYPVTWEKEKADTYNNPDCVATLSKGEENLLNVVMFPTRTNIEDYKLFMEDAISDDGGVILESDFVEIAGKHAIKTHANMDTPDINFDIHNYVFIENGNIYKSDYLLFCRTRCGTWHRLCRNECRRCNQPHADCSFGDAGI